MSFDWSEQQREALAKVRAWLEYQPDQKIFRLFGYAGTGKSTLAKYIGEIETKRGGYVQFCAYTGKAAVVMKRKGCLNASTIHSLIYTSRDKSTLRLTELEGQLIKAQGRDAEELTKLVVAERESLKAPAFSLKPDALTVWEMDEERGVLRPRHTITLFVVDECSMVDEKLAKDLLSFGARALVLGDPAQLPPVYSGAGYFTGATPDVLLTEIHRQALDSPIIGMADKVRRGVALNVGKYGEGCSVVNKTDMVAADWLNADQILVGRNETRKAFNGRIRQLKGFSGFLPEPGEKLVCLRNDHEVGLLNGSIWECVSSEDRPNYGNFLLTAKSLDEDREVKCIVHKAGFMGEEIEPWERRDAQEFDFGYALTVHKSQGSQWNNVVLYDEWSNRNSLAQWRYTGITRAAERLTIVKP